MPVSPYHNTYRNTYRARRAFRNTISALESAATYIPKKYVQRTGQRFSKELAEAKKAFAALPCCPNCNGAGWKEYPSGDGPVVDTCLDCNEEGA